MLRSSKDTNPLAEAATVMATGEAHNDLHDRLSGPMAGGHAHAVKLAAERRR